MELNIFWVCFFKCKSSDFLFKQAASRNESGTWVLGGYRYASWILLPLFIVKASCFYSWVRTDTCWPSPFVDSGWPASLPGYIRQCQADSPPPPARLAFCFRGKSRYKEADKNRTTKGSPDRWPSAGQPKPELLGVTFPVPFLRKDKLLAECKSNKGRNSIKLAKK